VSKLVLVSSAGFGRQITPFARLGVVKGIGEVSMLFLRPSIRLAANAMTVRRDFTGDGFVEALRAYAGAPGAKAATLAYLRMFVSIRGQARVFSAAELSALAMPTLVIWGARDPIFPAKHAQAARADIPDCRVVVLDRTGHAPPLERPDEFNRLLLDFLD
jgi:pimeloyl-ACP methyl ester carboxylesterase